MIYFTHIHFTDKRVKYMLLSEADPYFYVSVHPCVCVCVCMYACGLVCK